MTFIYYLQSVVCLVCPVLPVSLDCPFVITSSVFFNVYCRPMSCGPVLPVSLDCPFVITPSVFSNVYLAIIANPGRIVVVNIEGGCYGV